MIPICHLHSILLHTGIFQNVNEKRPRHFLFPFLLLSPKERFPCWKFQLEMLYGSELNVAMYLRRRFQLLSSEYLCNFFCHFSNIVCNRNQTEFAMLRLERRLGKETLLKKWRIFSSFFCWAKSNIELNSVILSLPYEIQKKVSILEFKTFFELLFKIITIHHHYCGNFMVAKWCHIELRAVFFRDRKRKISINRNVKTKYWLR